ncbi:SpoVR family protein [bacterium (Candidatus Blackallbacteria) CG17_big_fil_post_rev_8_21_14_2_50_48_46]|uniref:SpoVR family protein n=1 Tax=bacterium (Candidatus Blackallbacteria) CG17_big_fil_post_rev_8_21_14_2_50_48_46 TaxID=2014261 RepID=A0A2M7G5T8_9BACT|nr:MAG: SpoVR family protein [bacterium (Candidatus Blackallbacteria) CG18_big_fil_WC_8_21_14_2_50_49_26]PIW17217.1 MAG: SpoVR family protein [bacterium (Candidatus Blackallbacteria) CG17_big_fil_post_rev_8_21_14_2_50_48_46]PIW51008.1 MAG: SpoVR family protein [bacterium (Candidatus Blackallbacteria) CG13_big_fil_rev_8_21_14_2_50_49_14]
MMLTPELEATRKQIESIARDYGLDFFEVIYEMIDFETMNQIAAYDGFPVRYPHWRFGMEYNKLSKSYAYGLSKIYELVINTDPCYAYLMNCNRDVDQKTIMAHVYAHCDFFKNNASFAHTNRKMMDVMANHGTQVRQYIERYGEDTVEAFLDTALSLENLIDFHSDHIQRLEKKPYGYDEDAIDQTPNFRLRSKPHMEKYINPKEYIEEQERQYKEEQLRKKERFPSEPYRDVLLFLMENAPLENWQVEILSIVRDEALYFAPQRATKIMNEGWASYWHSVIMTQRAATASEIVDFADLHSGTMAMSARQLNPYKIGLEIYRDIEERWNTGRFGREYEECSSYEEKRKWDKQLGLGRQKIFEVRKVYNDVMFLDEFLTMELCERLKLFTFEYNGSSEQYEIASRQYQDIKQKLLTSLTNFGEPYIEIVDANHDNRGELYLVHTHTGVDLKLDYAQDTLANLYKVWKRPTNLETIVDERVKLLSYDGKEHTSRLL